MRPCTRSRRPRRRLAWPDIGGCNRCTLWRIAGFRRQGSTAVHRRSADHPRAAQRSRRSPTSSSWTFASPDRVTASASDRYLSAVRHTVGVRHRAVRRAHRDARPEGQSARLDRQTLRPVGPGHRTQSAARALAPVPDVELSGRPVSLRCRVTIPGRPLPCRP